MKEKESHHINWDLISNYLNGEMNTEDKLAFEKLIAINAEYAKIVTAVNKDLNCIHELNKIHQQFDVDKAWLEVKSKLKNQPEKATKFPFFARQNAKKILQIAAMLLITIGLGFASYRIYTDRLVPYQSISSEINESSTTITLPDASLVSLHGESKLIYEKSFSGKERRVQLIGEAYFEIAKNPEKPFIISVGNAEIKVLGTSFNVNALHKQIEVLVETGKVQFSNAKEPNRSLILEKGDFAILRENLLEKRTQNDENYLSWKTKLMVFKAMSLEQVAKVIDRTYQVQIEFSDTSIQNLPITTSFNQTPIEEVLENLCRPHKLRYQINGHRIIIEKKVE
ncbi:FecR family protein [Labilibaculum sp.]|uniref:FecR family protein n=1 Tax=Labilibaculum sp. TaxID=2060723 RepID=UPI003568D5A4